MHVMVIGAAGMVGRKLVERLAVQEGALGATLSRLSLVDVAEPPVPAALAAIASSRTLDLSAPGAAGTLAAARPDLIFHLAAVV